MKAITIKLSAHAFSSDALFHAKVKLEMVAEDKRGPTTKELERREELVVKHEQSNLNNFQTYLADCSTSHASFHQAYDMFLQLPQRSSFDKQRKLLSGQIEAKFGVEIKKEKGRVYGLKPSSKPAVKADFASAESKETKEGAKG